MRPGTRRRLTRVDLEESAQLLELALRLAGAISRRHPDDPNLTAAELMLDQAHDRILRKLETAAIGPPEAPVVEELPL
jgi:hypothetical protein